MKKAMFLAMIIYYFFIIFLFSAQPAAESSSSSEGITGFIYDKVISFFDCSKALGKENFVEMAEHTVRKCAHFGNFFIFSLLIAGFTACFDRDAVVSVLTAFTVSFVFAFFDEVHQLFVEGRSCQLSDMLIDSNGAMLGILVFFTVRKYKRREMLL